MLHDNLGLAFLDRVIGGELLLKLPNLILIFFLFFFYNFFFGIYSLLELQFMVSKQD